MAAAQRCRCGRACLQSEPLRRFFIHIRTYACYLPVLSTTHPCTHACTQCCLPWSFQPLLRYACSAEVFHGWYAPGPADVTLSLSACGRLVAAAVAGAGGEAPVTVKFRVGLTPELPTHLQVRLAAHRLAGTAP